MAITGPLSQAAAYPHTPQKSTHANPTPRRSEGLQTSTADQQRANSASGGPTEGDAPAFNETHLLLREASALNLRQLSYSAYGYRGPHNRPVHILGLNGEAADPVTGCYLLGNGYRAFNPVLMRFNNPDSWSPFGKGGVNAYGYCTGDPINNTDPTGHGFFTKVLTAMGFREKKTYISSANPCYIPAETSAFEQPRRLLPATPEPSTSGSGSAEPIYVSVGSAIHKTGDSTAIFKNPADHIYDSINKGLHLPGDNVRIIRVTEFPRYSIVTSMDESGTIRVRHHIKGSNVGHHYERHHYRAGQ